jgi:CDP-4-dehydro-6-deoxyglucose reductase
MPHRITVEPSRHQFEVEPGNTILRAALAAGVTLPYGCRNGACGACKGRVLAGEVDRGLFMDGALSAEDLARGYALFCCARPLSDLVIESREVGDLRDIPVKNMPCRVHSMTRLAPDVMRLELKLPASERLQFLAGQYIDILLKDGRRRSFSLANAPQADEMLELHVRRVPGGHAHHPRLQHDEGARHPAFRGSARQFLLREDAGKPAILMAGGTGFAPIKALIEQAWQQKSTRPLSLYWGARDRAGLYLHEVAQAGPPGIRIFAMFRCCPMPPPRTIGMAVAAWCIRP